MDPVSPPGKSQCSPHWRGLLQLCPRSFTCRHGQSLPEPLLCAWDVARQGAQRTDQPSAARAQMDQSHALFFSWTCLRSSEKSAEWFRTVTQSQEVQGTAGSRPRRSKVWASERVVRLGRRKQGHLCVDADRGCPGLRITHRPPVPTVPRPHQFCPHPGPKWLPQ